MTGPETAVVVLAAGLGTRMRSGRPKALHPVAGRAMIGYVLDAAARLEPRRTVVVVGPGMDALSQAVAPAISVVQERQLGTGDAVKAARGALEGFAGDVVVLLGDAPLITVPTLERLLAARRGEPAPAVAVLGMRLAEPGAYGRLKLAADGSLEAIVEARDASAAELEIDLCNSGMMAVDGRVLFELLDEVGSDNAKGEVYLTDIVGLARARGLRCAAVEGPAAECLGVNSRAELAVAESLMQERLRAAAMAQGATLTDPTTVHFCFDTALGRDVTIGPSVVFGPGVVVNEGAEIRAFCHIEGARIAPHAVVGPFARLRAGSEVGPGARVGNFVEVKNARLEEGAKANHLSYIGDTRVGPGANIGAGTITCNYDGFAKHGTDIGAGAFIGSNVALVAPVRVGDGAIVGAGSVITRDVEADAIAVARGQQANVERGAARLKARKRAEKAGPARKGAEAPAEGPAGSRKKA